MKKYYLAAGLVVAFTGASSLAHATNGDNLIGIGPIARAMGGVGVAAPQDAISAVFANPAAMCFGPYCPGSQFDFASSIFDPSVSTDIKLPPAIGTSRSGESQADPYIIPAIAIAVPINLKWRFGLSAYGVSGLGVDYRNQLNFGGLAGDGQIFTDYQVMKFAPKIAYLVNENFSLGASLHVDYAALDLESGKSHGYTAGIQVGAIYKISPFSFGLSYVSPQSVTHERVFDFDGNGTMDNFDLEQPQTVAAGIAVEPMTNLLVEFDTKWINWSSADGYEDFDWDDQWVFAIGAQYKPMEKLALRAGFNYSSSPVNEHNDWNGAAPYTLQGMALADGRFGFEYFRIVGFPAIVESHLSLGVGYRITDSITLNLGYMHAFENDITESGFMALPTLPVEVKSTLSEDSFEFGVSWTF